MKEEPKEEEKEEIGPTPPIGDSLLSDDERVEYLAREGAKLAVKFSKAGLAALAASNSASSASSSSAVPKPAVAVKEEPQDDFDDTIRLPSLGITAYFVPLQESSAAAASTSAATPLDADAKQSRSLVHDGGDDDADDAAQPPPVPEPSVLEIWPDLAKVPTSNTGARMYSIYRKQVESVGCVLWDNLDACRVVQTKHLTWQHIQCWACTSDQGDDEKKCFQYIQRATSDRGLILVFWWACLQHICHRMFIPHLKLHEKINNLVKPYWNLTATIVNVIRTPGSLRKLRAWVETYLGPEVAEDIFGRLPQRPLKNRWGMALYAALYIIKGGWVLVRAFNEVFKEKAAENDDDDDDDDDNYHAKGRKWSREAIQGLSNKDFWCLLWIKVITEWPAGHMQHYLSKEGDTAENFTLVNWILFKCKQISAEWDDLLKDDLFEEKWASLLEYLDEDLPIFFRPFGHYAM